MAEYRLVPVIPFMRVIVCPKCRASVGPDQHIPSTDILLVGANGAPTHNQDTLKFRCRCGEELSVHRSEAPGLVFQNLPSQSMTPVPGDDDDDEESHDTPPETDEASRFGKGAQL